MLFKIVSSCHAKKETTYHIRFCNFSSQRQIARHDPMRTYAFSQNESIIKFIQVYIAEKTLSLYFSRDLRIY